MISVEDHLATILAAVRPVDQITLPLREALGSTLGTAVRSAVDLPLFDNSAMDGFAVRWADVAGATDESPIALRVIADLPAGTASNPVIGQGEAARIMTGAPLPASADTVVPFEATVGGLADSLTSCRVVRAPRAIGAHVRRRGEELIEGSEIVARGMLLGPLQLSAIAAANLDAVTVARRPRVAVISTGSELVAPGGALTRGQIPESNALLLSTLATDIGADVVLQTSVGDVDDDLRNALTATVDLDADAVITSGGVSAGAYEVVKSALASMTFSTVAMQPGKPQGFAAGPPLHFGLPGNPVSAAVSFEVFVRPALLAMQGRTDLYRRMQRLPVQRGWRGARGRRQYVPILCENGSAAPVIGNRARGTAGLARADGYAVVPSDVDSVSTGDLVDVMLFS